MINSNKFNQPGVNPNAAAVLRNDESKNQQNNIIKLQAVKQPQQLGKKHMYLQMQEIFNNMTQEDQDSDEEQIDRRPTVVDDEFKQRQLEVQQMLDYEFYDEYALAYDEVKQTVYLDIIQMNKFERIKHYKDEYWFLSIRKAIWFVQAQQISFVNSLFKIAHEALSLINFISIYLLATSLNTILAIYLNKINQAKTVSQKKIQLNNRSMAALGFSWAFQRILLLRIYNIYPFYIYNRYISDIAYRIIKHQLFEGITLIIIIMNSILLANEDPTSDSKDSFSQTMDFIFLIAYSIEMGLKIIGMGFLFNNGAYLRDAWNILDFVIVSTAYLPYILNTSSGVNLSGLRSLRVLRPLRTISSIKALKNILLALFSAMRLLIDSIIILLFFFMVFAIGGVQLFQGVLKKQCFNSQTDIVYKSYAVSRPMCLDDSDCYVYNNATTTYICGKMMENPNFGITNFDTFGWAFLQVFQIITLEGWTDIMLYVMKTFNPASLVYFILTVFIGSFFLMNLTLAVIKSKFTQQQNDDSKDGSHVKQQQLTNITEDNQMKLQNEHFDIIKFRRWGIYVNPRDRGTLYLQLVKQKSERKFNQVHALNSQIIHINTKTANNFVESEDQKRISQKFGKGEDTQPGNYKNGYQQVILLPLKNDQNNTENSLNDLTSPNPNNLNNNPNKKQLSPEEQVHSPKSPAKQRLSLTRNSFSQQKQSTDHLQEVTNVKNTTLGSPINRQNSIGKSPTHNHQQDGGGSNGRQQFNQRSPTRSPSRKMSSAQVLAAQRRKSSRAPTTMMLNNNNNNRKQSIRRRSTRRLDPVFAAHYIMEEKEEREAQYFRDMLDWRYLKPYINYITNYHKQDQDVLPKINERIMREQQRRHLFLLKKKKFKISYQFDNPFHEPNYNKYVTGSLQDQIMSRFAFRQVHAIPSFDENDRNQLLVENIQNKKQKLSIRQSKSSLAAQRLQQKRNTITNVTMYKKRVLLTNQNLQTANATNHQNINYSSKQNVNETTALWSSDIAMKYLFQRPELSSEDLLGVCGPSNQEYIISNKTNNAIMAAVQVTQKLMPGGQNENEPDQKNSLLTAQNTAANQIISKSSLISPRRDQLGGNNNGSQNVSKQPSNVNTERAGKDKKGSSRNDTAGRFLARIEQLEIQSNLVQPKIEKVEDQIELYNKHYEDSLALPMSEYHGGAQVPLPWSGEDVLAQANIQMLTGNLIELSHAQKIIRALNYSLKDIEMWEGGLIGIIQGFRRIVNSFAHSKFFDNFIMLCVLANTVVLSLDGLVNDDQGEYILNQLNFSFTIVFTVDMGLKVIGLGPIEYLRDKMNVFDAIIVSLSLVELAIFGNSGGSAISAFRSVRIFRTFRVLRVTRLIRSLQYMKIIMDVISQGLSSYMYIALLLGLFCFIYTLLGMQLFGGAFTKTSPRFVFDSFYMAFLCVFDILTMENWNNLLYNALDSTVPKYFTIIYFITWIFIGNYVLLNLFLAIMLDGFDQDTFKADIEEDFEVVKDLEIDQQQQQGALTEGTHSDKSSVIMPPDSKKNSQVYPMQYQQAKLSTVQSSNNNFLQENNQTLGLQLSAYVGQRANNRNNQSQQFDLNEKDLKISQFKRQNTAGQGGQSPNITSNNVRDRSHTARSIEGMPQLTIQFQANGGKGVQGMNALQLAFNQAKQNYDDNEDEAQVSFRKKQNLNRQESNQANGTQTEAKYVYFENIECEYAWFLFSKENFIRKLVYRLVKHIYFELFILAVIIINSMKMVIDTYIPDNDPAYKDINDIGNYINMTLTILFCIEALLKALAFGFIMDENSYLRDSWSQLDFFIVVSGVVDYALDTGVDLSFVKILRLFRTFRPLRFISHNRNIKLMVTALLESFSGIANVSLVIIMIMLMFSILAINLQKGKMWRCILPPDSTKTSYDIPDQQTCNTIPGASWQNNDLNCDDIIQTMVFLFLLNTQEGWPDYLWQFVDGTESGPSKDNNIYFTIFFVFYIFIGSMFLMQLFNGIIFLNYQIAENKAKSQYLTDGQTKWIELQRLIVKSQPDYNSIKPPNNLFQRKMWYFCESNYLETIVLSCVVLNVVTMAMAYEGANAQYESILKTINLVFSAVFIVEAIIKFIAYGLIGYFYSGWNQFDFFVICTSIIDIVMDFQGKSFISFLKVGPQLARIFRVLKVTRLLKLIKSFQGLQKLIQVALYALPQLINVSMLLGLIYFIFAILSVYLYKNITTGNIISADRNFSDFGHAVLLLFQCTTGENWYQVMFDTVRGQNSYSHVLFHIIFQLATKFIGLQLFILVILQQFQDNFISENNPLSSFNESEGVFKKLWSKMTVQEKGKKMKESQILDFFMDLEEPVGANWPANKEKYEKSLKENKDQMTQQEFESTINKEKFRFRSDASKRLMKMNITVDEEGYVYYNQMLFYFIKDSIKSELDERDKQKNYDEGLKIVNKMEIQTMAIIEKLKSQHVNKYKRINNQQGQTQVNPLVKLLFVKMCYKSWGKFARLRKNDENKAQENLEIIMRDRSQASHEESETNESNDNFNSKQYLFVTIPDNDIYRRDDEIYQDYFDSEVITKNNDNNKQQKVQQKSIIDNLKPALINNGLNFNNSNNQPVDSKKVTILSRKDSIRIAPEPRLQELKLKFQDSMKANF